MVFFCFNCKIQKPEFGNSCCEKIATLISMILFVLFLVEIAAYSQFISSFQGAEGVSCCGAIEQSSSYLEGALCFEDNFPEQRPYIPRQEINGSYFCKVGNTVCNQWNISLSNYSAFYDELTPNKTTEITTFETCLAEGNFSTFDMCNEEILEEATKGSISNAITACYVCLFFGILTSSLCLCEFVGCFRDSQFCENKCAMLCLKSCEVYFWLAIVIMSITLIENPAGNGYVVKALSSSDTDADDAWNYLERNCNTEAVDDDDVQENDYGYMDLIWTELEIDIPGWLASDAYNFIGYFGITVSIIEFMIYFWQQCCQGNKNKKDDGENFESPHNPATSGQTSTHIEMPTSTQ